MAAVNDSTTLTGLFKEVYASKLERLVPSQNRFLKDIGFVSAKEQNGNKYNQPVNMTMEHGVTYAGPDAGAFDLNGSVASTTKNAEIKGSQILIEGAIDYESAAKASSGKAAFVTGVHYLITNMMESISKRTELSTIYGGVGLGKISAAAVVSATTSTVTITIPTFAIGIWPGMENAVVNFYNGASQISSGADGKFTITSINILARTMLVTGTATGSTALTAFAFGTLDIFYDGSKGKEMAGIDQIITNNTTLFNIDASVYSLWKGQTVDVGAVPLTIGKILNGLSTAQAYGLNEMVDLYVSPATWNNINTELAGNRRFDGSYKKEGTNGFEDIMYYSNNGGIRIIAHSYVKQSEAFCLPLTKWKRLGAQDISFNTPGRGDEIFRQLETKAGYGFRAYTNQAAFCSHPSRCIKYFNITNS